MSPTGSRATAGCGCPHHGKHHRHQADRPSPPHRSGAGLLAGSSWLLRYAWFIFWRNRFAVAVASLIWLISRSGAQPRRLAYPCQQAAAANLGCFAVLLIPHAARRGSGEGRSRRRAVALVTGTVALTGLVGLLVSAVIPAYSDYVLSSMALSIPAPVNPPAPTTVSITRTPLTTLTTAGIEALVRKAVADAGGLTGIVQAGDRVSIKPNLVNDNVWSTSNPTGVTTDPRVVAAVVKLCKEAGASAVTIVEGSAGPADWDTNDPVKLGRGITWLAYQSCGYDVNHDYFFDYDPTVTLVDLNDAGTGGLVPRPVTTAPPNTVAVTLANGVIRSKYYVPKIIASREQGGFCDVLISVPALKNHGNGGITLAMKNRVGCAPSDIYHVTTYIPDHSNQMKWDLSHWAVPGGPVGGTIPFPRNVTHNSPAAPSGTAEIIENTTVHYSIVDLNLVRPNDFVVVDGLVGITNGPTGTTKSNPLARVIMAGRDSVAVDSIGSLIMGYNPLENLAIGWAWNRELGNRDSAYITVVGDHVKDVRRSFPCGYGGTVCVEATPPTIGNVLPADGTQVFGDVVVTGSGLSDDAGVIKAELTARLTGGVNLLANGDFESGSTGWATWRASWGGAEAWDFNSTEPGAIDGKCLHLTSGGASFGVYQQVAVTPGKTYRVDAYWKGKKLSPNGGDNWYEVLLLDGSWDYGQADGNPNVAPYDDPSEPVFNEMYGYDSHTYSMTADFGWEWTHDLNATPIDTINRDGLRVASGNVMTVVLKAGACCEATGASGWFDNISLVEVDTGEQLVATLPYPGDPFDIVWPSRDWPNGNYELTLTIYDAALNEATVRRQVIKTEIPKPIISLSSVSFERTLNSGEVLTDDSFTIQNTGIGTLNYRFSADQPWLTVEPATGASEGEADTISLSYNTVGLGVGTHTALVTVLDDGSTPLPAHNAPQTITVTLHITTVKPDFDRDCDVDQDDFGTLQRCLDRESVQPADPGCLALDLDDDLDVDWRDVGLFMNCFGSPNVCADPACDDAYP